MKKVKSGPIALAVHDAGRVQAHLPGQCSAASSARLPAGTGRVNDICTIASPVVSPYGRMI